MKLFAAITFLFASLVGTPAPCPHAMGVDVTDEAFQSISNDPHADHNMNHQAADTAGGDGAFDHLDHGCTDGCDGGFGCADCTITNAVISIANEVDRNFIAQTSRPANFVAAADKPIALDPPPPRI